MIVAPLTTRPFRKARLLLCGVFLGLPFLGALAAPPATAPGATVVFNVKGAIGVATGDFVAKALARAKSENAGVAVMRLDTPGGLLESTREVIQAILASPVPVVVYVAPSGARAASAGTYMVYAAHVAAMAPGTHLGAATPVRMGGVPGGPPPEPPDAAKKKKGAPAGDDAAMEKKILNDSVAYLRTLAQLRGRNAAWAEKAVRDGATLTAEEALKQGVVEIVARDLPDLLAQLDGRTVRTAEGDRRLATKDKPVVEIAPDFRTRFLAVIADPNVAFILMLIGVYGILFEFWHPGAVAPGVIGGISLIVAAMALAMLPVDYAGLALLLLGMALMVAEAFAPSFGALGIGGLAAFVFGAIFLFDENAADFEFGVALPVIAAGALTSFGMLAFVLGFAIKARRRPVVSGAEQIIGSTGTVVDWQGEEGRIRTHGEVWAARAVQPIDPGRTVRIVGRHGLTLIVEPA